MKGNMSVHLRPSWFHHFQQLPFLIRIFCWTSCILLWHKKNTTSYAFSVSKSSRRCSNTWKYNTDNDRNTPRTLLFAKKSFCKEQKAQKKRRDFFQSSISSSLAVVFASQKESANAFSLFGKSKQTTEVLPIEPVQVEYDSLSSEYCLLKLLPVNNSVFRTLQKKIEQVSVLRILNVEPTVWKNAQQYALESLEYLDSNRSKIQRVFNENDSAYMQILKEEKFEILVETLRDNVITMTNSTVSENLNESLDAQRRALLALAEVGELLVSEFPYEVPVDGKYANLPRLLGRCKVTFSFTSNNNKPIGDVTLMVDGFAAPLTAGNFIDLCLRNFYPGLPIIKKKKDLNEAPIIEQIELRPSILADTLATITDKFERTKDKESLLNFPIFGSYKEGFIDPLTAKPRHIPLEVVRIQSSGMFGTSKAAASLVYSSSFSSKTVNEDELQGTPVLDFKVPGIIAMNHPDQFPNSASSEFFFVPEEMRTDECADLMNGRYAPFAYVIDGFDVLQKLKPGDIIASNKVDDFGVYNLKKIKGSSLSDLIGTDDEEEED